MQNKIKNFFGKFFKKQKNSTKNNFKKNTQLFLIIGVILIGIFSVKTIGITNIQNFSAKIILENFGNPNENFSKENKNFLTLEKFLEKIKSGEDKKIEDLEYIYEMNFENFGEILDEKITQTGDKINFYFEATVNSNGGKGGSVHEFFYEGKIVDGEILEIKESGENFEKLKF